MYWGIGQGLKIIVFNYFKTPISLDYLQKNKKNI